MRTTPARAPRSLYFEPNRAPFGPGPSFLVRARGFVAFISAGDALFALPGSRIRPAEAPPATGRSRDIDVGLVHMRFPGTRAGAVPVGAGLLEGRSHYLLGRDPSAWVTGVPHYAEVRCDRVLPGADLRWHAGGGELEYDLHFAPGVDPAAFPIEFEGADSLELAPSGDLLVRRGEGVLRHSRPEAWQTGPEGRVPVAARFELGERGRVGIRVGRFDPALPLVVDPRVAYSGYLGGSDEDVSFGLAVDPDGNMLLAGSTISTNFPLQSPFQGTYAGSHDAFVSKFSASGGSLLYSTYIGGSTWDEAYAIAADAAGNAVVVGYTQSTDFPTHAPYQAALGGPAFDDDAFVLKLDAGGSALAYSTYLGGTGLDHATAVAVDSAGAAFVAGDTRSSGFPTTQGAFQRVYGGEGDAFVTKFSAAGTALSYSTFLGGAGQEGSVKLAIDSSGAAYVAGDALGSGFPLVTPFQANRSGGVYDVFVSKLNASGSALAYSTYVGGDLVNQLAGIAVNARGEAVIAGTTTSTTLPTKFPIYLKKGSSRDAFVTSFTAAGTGLVFSTYLGAGNQEGATGVALDPLGAVYVVGHSSGGTFPIVSPSQPFHGDGDLTDDGFVTKFVPSGTSLVYSTYLGGKGVDRVHAIAIDGTDAVVAGRTQAANFPVLLPLQGAYGGGGDAFVTRLITTPRPPTELIVLLINPYRIDLNWRDNSNDETSFEVERKEGDGAWMPVDSVPAGTVDYSGFGLKPDTVFTYRVRAVNADGPSTWSIEGSAQTPPGPPSAPSAPGGLAATVLSPTSVGLAWFDTAYNEDYFEVGRSLDGTTYGVLGTPAAGTTSYADGACLPDRTYWYHVRAANAQGSSLFSNAAAAVIPATADLSVSGGTIVDSAKLGRDSFRISGTLALIADTDGGVLDLQADGLQVRLGTQAGAPVVTIPPAAEGWVLKKGVLTWKSPRGFPTKAKVTFNVVSGALSVTVKKATLASAPANPVRISISTAAEAGHFEADWSAPSKGGALKFPPPAPKGE